MNAAASLEYAAPLLAAAAGSLAAERSGRTNMALEGLVLSGAFVAAYLGSAGFPPAAAIAAAAFACGVLAFAYSLFLSCTGADPVISGISANAILAAAVAMLARSVSGSAGVWRFGGEPGTAGALRDACLAALFFAAVRIMIGRTRAGLRLRAAGSSRDALLSAGGDPEASRHLAFIVSGLGTGLAGAFLAESLRAYSPGMSAGRGWIALAAVYAGDKRSRGTLIAVAVFVAADAVSVLAQAWSPAAREFSAMIPPLAATAALAVAGMRHSGYKS
jgi:general nucleoside transport system permease protein